MGAQINMNGSFKDDGISDKTKVTLPLSLQIIVYIFIISTTITLAMGWDSLVTKDEKHDEKIQVIESNKLDKTTYEKDRSNDKIIEEINGKKLDAIMKKLKIENY